jgi:hypothetical protein
VYRDLSAGARLELIRSAARTRERARSLSVPRKSSSGFVSRDGDTAPVTFTSGLCNLNATVTTFVADGDTFGNAQRRVIARREHESIAPEVQSRFMDAAVSTLPARYAQGITRARGGGREEKRRDATRVNRFSFAWN